MAAIVPLKVEQPLGLHVMGIHDLRSSNVEPVLFGE